MKIASCSTLWFPSASCTPEKGRECWAIGMIHLAWHRPPTAWLQSFTIPTAKLSCQGFRRDKMQKVRDLSLVLPMLRWNPSCKVMLHLLMAWCSHTSNQTRYFSLACFKYRLCTTEDGASLLCSAAAVPSVLCCMPVPSEQSSYLHHRYNWCYFHYDIFPHFYWEGLSELPSE